jgi:hypothetical protein
MLGEQLDDRSFVSSLGIIMHIHGKFFFRCVITFIFNILKAFYSLRLH